MGIQQQQNFTIQAMELSKIEGTNILISNTQSICVGSFMAVVDLIVSIVSLTETNQTLVLWHVDTNQVTCSIGHCTTNFDEAVCSQLLCPYNYTNHAG